MRYTSTRDNNILLEGSQAIIQGISEDGGLFVPEEFKKIRLEDLLDMDYQELAYEILGSFFTDFSEESLRESIKNAYDRKFTHEEIAPLTQVGEMFILELFHGPTLAFKDMALSILPYLLKEAKEINAIEEEIVILTATSGDTGKAALEGFADVEGTRIVVFYPEEGVSKIQKLQMDTQEGDNTLVVGIDGNFDHAQDGVKKIFNDDSFRELLRGNNFMFSSANSINIGRLVPQIIYYFASYIELLKEGKIEDGEEINIVVPTGNFGNILAAYYGKRMGLPINKLISASNENKVISDFIQTGVYDRRRELNLTSSPSMDILISSNLERLLYHLGYKDQELEELMDDLASKGIYKIDKKELDEFYSGYSTDEEVEATIKRIFEDHDYLLDTHTAVGIDVYRKYRDETGDRTKTIVASTASPFKFGGAVAEAVGIDTENRGDFEIIEELAQKTGTPIPRGVMELEDKEIIHKNKCERDGMEEEIKRFLGLGDSDD